MTPNSWQKSQRPDERETKKKRSPTETRPKCQRGVEAE